MRRTLAIGMTCLLLTVAVYARGRQDKTPSRAQLLTVGRITKIDSKKRVLTVRSENESSSSNSSGQPQGSRRRGGRVGAGRRRDGGGFPGGGPFPGGNGGRPGSTSKDQGKEFKVVVTDKTAIKEGESSISFLNLNVGDHITIQGLPKGSGPDLEASEIKLNH